MYTTLTRSIAVALALAGSFMPLGALAATASFKTSSATVHVGDTVVVEVRLDTEGQSVNVVEGTLTLGSAAVADVRDLGVAGSAFTLWPRTPALVPGSTQVTFTGGVPNGVNSADALLLTVALRAKKAGALSLTATRIRAYANDGKGSLVEVRVKARSVTVVKAVPGVAARDEWQARSQGDVTPPEPFLVTTGRSQALFEGRQFIAFSTTDTQSGIAYYEITEGDLPPVHSDHTYELQRQGVAETVTVRAYDQAGNVRASTLAIEAPVNRVSASVLALLLVLLLASVVVWRRRRSK